MHPKGSGRVWKEFASFFKTNPELSLLITVFGTLTVWLYKEFKVMYSQSTKNKLTTVQKKLDFYGKLEASIATVINQPNDPNSKRNLLDKLGESNSYFSEDIRQIIRDYYRQADVFLLITLIAFIEMEMKKLDEEKRTLTSSESPVEIMDYIARLMKPVGPIIVFFAIIFGSVGLGLLVMQQNTLWNKLLLIAFSLSSLFSLMISIALFSLMISNKLSRQGKYRWVLDGCMIFTPCLAFLYWNLSLILPIIQLISLILYIRSEKPRQIIILN